MKKETNKKEMSFVKINIYLILGCFLLLCISTVAYAALNQELYITGDLVIRAVKDLRITNLTYSGNTNSEELFNAKFTANTITISNNPTSSTGSVVYKATIKNSGTVDMEVSELTITPNSSDVTVWILNETLKEGTVIKAGETVNFTIDIYGKSGSAIIEFTFEEYVPPYTDLILAGNDPNMLQKSLTPVVYDETRSSWVVADTTQEWYNYSNQEWANAVILNSGVTKSVGDTVIVPTDTSTTSEVKAMLVWIPRFEYKITSTYGTHLDGTAGTQALPGQIEVKFIPKSQTTADSNYILHPAFTWDDNSDGTIATNEHISGIWVGKFETTGTADEPTILPNVQSLRNQNISTQFNTSLKLKNYLSAIGTTDSHMAKNSEWGAVAYLSQSVYGKYGNTNYTGANKEVYKNDSSGYYTGRSSGTYPQSGNPSSGNSSSGTCLYNDITDRGNGIGSCGGGASTTGNITGIYDMAGGAYEYVMGYLTTASTTWGATSSTNHTGFTSAPASKYYDAYTSTTATTACNGGICKGHALSETSGWYNDSADFVSAVGPWFARGGSSYSTPRAGVFYSTYGNGGTADRVSFRSVLLTPEV